MCVKCQTCPTGLAYSPDGKLMATLAKDRKVCELFFLNLKIDAVESKNIFTSSVCYLFISVYCLFIL